MPSPSMEKQFLLCIFQISTQKGAFNGGGGNKKQKNLGEKSF